jgi:hypothetical protein
MNVLDGEGIEDREQLEKEEKKREKKNYEMRDL